VNLSSDIIQTESSINDRKPETQTHVTRGDEENGGNHPRNWERHRKVSTRPAPLRVGEGGKKGTRQWRKGGGQL